MPNQSKEVAFVIAEIGPLNGHRWPIEDQVLIGRDANCEIVIADRQVSRNHARFAVTPAGVLLEDLGSKNGTHRNGKKITEPVILADGDLIQIALVQKFLFLSSDATVPLDGSDLVSAEPKTQNSFLRLDQRSRRVWIGEEEILPPLSLSQFSMLYLLYENSGEVVSRQALIAAIWGDGQAIDVSEQALDALVRRLRDRISSIDPENNYITTIRGHGLRLDNPTH